MKIYGEELFWLGIVLLVITLIIAAVFFVIHRITSSRLKKQLELEYGPQNK